MIYIVSWILVEIFTVPCECNQPKYDDYGRHINANYIQLMHCTDTREEKRVKKFNNINSVNDFIANAPKKTFGMNDYCTDFNIDSCGVWIDGCDE